MSLDMTNIEVQFGGIKALDMVSVHVQPKQVLGVIGPNGSGLH
jgi:ABC-type branched-subunit amino acid transport system ATPase component